MGRLPDDPPHAQTLTEGAAACHGDLKRRPHKKITGAERGRATAVADADALGRPRRSVLSLSLIVNWAASIGRRNHGKEIDIHDDNETQNREGQIGPRSGEEHDHDTQ